jgi:hypothetical protein
MKNNVGIGAGDASESIRARASNEYFSSVECHLYAHGESTQLDADESDVVNDFALQAFGAAACARFIITQRAESV